MDADCARDRRARQYLVPRRHAGAGRRGDAQILRLGVDSFLIRGFDPFNDAVEFGRELIPRIKAGAIEIDRLRAAE